MVRQGFLNLTSAEQENVFEAALNEFARADFESASINRIIESAGITKGSMYHYFLNKEDLYFYVLDRAIADKSAFMQTWAGDHAQKAPVSKIEQADSCRGTFTDESQVSSSELFSRLFTMMHASLAFARAYPRYQQMNQHLLNRSQGPFKERVWERFSRGFDCLVQDMVVQAEQSGTFRPGMDTDFVIRILKFFLLRSTELIADIQVLQQMHEPELHKRMNQLLDFLAYGLKNHGIET